MDPIIVFVAKYLLFASVAIAAIYWLTLQRRMKFQLALAVVVGGIIALLLARIGASFYYDTRPFVSQHVKPLIAHANDNGFPSDHALLASFLGFVVWRSSKSVSALLLILAVCIGAARVAAHIHNPIDIVGSFVISAISVVLVTVISQRLSRHRHGFDWRQRPIH